MHYNDVHPAGFRGALEEIRKSFMDNMFNDFLGVQPLTPPTGLIHDLHNRYKLKDD